MAVAIDTQAGGPSSAPSGTTVTVSITIASNSNRLLLVGLFTDSTGTTATGVTYNGVSMTKIVGYDDGYTTEAWQLVAPSTGTNNIVATYADSSTNRGIVAVSLYNVDQTNPISDYDTDGYLNDNTDRGKAVTVPSDGAAFTIGIGDNGYFNAGDANSTFVASAYFDVYSASANTVNTRAGMVRSAVPVPSAGDYTPVYDAATGSWGRAISIAIEPAAGSATGPASLKTRDTIAKASIKTIDGIAIASVKTIDTIA